MITQEVILAAQASQRKYGVPASVTIAQFGLESTWGTKEPQGSNNPFGIKAVAGQPSVTVKTREVIGGKSVYVFAAFRKFTSLQEAFDAHGDLLATSKYYTKAMAVRHSPDAFADALTGVYATDPNYGTALKSLMKADNLYQYNTLPSVSPAPDKVTPPPMTAPAPAPTPTPVVPKPAPTIAQSIQVDWGSWVSQALKHETALVESAATAGATLVLSKIPFGTLVLTFMGPQVVKQYVDQVLSTLEGLASTQTLSFTADGILGAVAKAVNAAEPELAALLSDDLEPMILAELKTLGIV